MDVDELIRTARLRLGGAERLLAEATTDEEREEAQEEVDAATRDLADLLDNDGMVD